MQGVLDFDNSSGSGDDDYVPQQGAPMSFDTPSTAHHLQVPQQPYDLNINSYGTPPYSAPINQQEFAFNDVSSMPLNASHTTFQEPSPFTLPPTGCSLHRLDSTWSAEQYSAAELSDILGELKINENGVGK